MMKKVIRVLIAAAFALVGAVGLIGLLLPREHVASIQIRLEQPSERVFDAISDIPGGMRWRSDLQHLEIVSGPDQPLRWTERTDWGTITMVVEETRPPTRLVTRIDDPDQPFGGRWIHDLSPGTGGTVLTITERGEIHNPFYRFLSRFVFGHYQALETYARDLARHLGSSAEPVRVRA